MMRNRVEKLGLRQNSLDGESDRFIPDRPLVQIQFLVPLKRRNKMYKVSFEYADAYSNWQWRKQHCTLDARDEDEAVEKCKQLYGLGVDCDFNITEIEEI